MCFAFIPEMVEGVFLHAYPPEMASLPREREKNKQLQASYSTSIVQRIIQKFFLLSFPFWPQEKEEGFLYLSCDIFILYSRVERILKKKKFSTRQVVPNC